MFKRSLRLASILLVIVLFLSPVESPAQAADGGSTYEDYSTGSTFRTETISAGTAHVCAVESDGTLNCWGLNDDYQASPNSYTSIYTQIASGGQHTCAIRENGTVDCWGDQSDGKLDPPDADAIYLQISAGENFTCGILEDGSISCWGNDDDYQIADAPTSGVWTQVDAGNRHACAIDTAGAVTCWGDDSSSQASPLGGTFYQVSGGDNHTCGLKSDSTIVCWGDNTGGKAPATATGDAYTQVSAGSTHTCAITAAGYGATNNLTCWGSDSDGQVSDVPDEYFTQVTSGANFTCAIEADGEVDCWGYPDDGQTALPSDLTSLGTLQMAIGSTAACIINPNGSLKCWGNTSYAETATLINETPATGVFTQVSMTYRQACAIKDNGSLVCWGFFDANDNGPFVQVSVSDYHACAVSPWGGVECFGPTSAATQPPAGVLFRQVSAGPDFTCGIKTDNTLQCWGNNYNNHTNPPAGTYKQLSTGKQHSCAIDTDGHVQCWGDNSYNSLVEPPGTFKQISSSNLHNCAIRTDNTVYCWGMEDFYPGNPELIANDPPAGIRFRQVTDFCFDACGITAAGTLACWGANNHGQAPQTTITPATLPRTTVGYAYSQQLAYSGGTAPYTTSLYSGSLPPGLSLSGAGLISGTPTAAAGGNTYTFTVRVRYTHPTLTGLLIDSFKTYTTKINRPPVVTSRTVHVNEDSITDIMFNATDPDGDTLSHSATTTAFWHSSYFTLLGGGGVRYEPYANWNGSGDHFFFRASDGLVTSTDARMDIIVDPVEDIPVANQQAVTTAEDTPKAITLTASDGDGDALTYAIASNPAHGTLSGTPPAVTYTPEPNWSGTAIFTFTATDTKSNKSSPANIIVTVSPVNDPPTTSDLAVSTPEDTPKAITLPGADVDNASLTYTIISSPAHGALSGTGANRTYTPNANWSGTDTFTFQVGDGALNSNPAMATITVTPVNDAPIPPAQGSVTWQISKPYTLVIPAFTDVDSTGLTYTARQQGGGALPAWLTFNAATRTFSGTPPASSVGSYVLEVTASDGSKTGTLTFTLKVVREIKVYLPLLSK